MKNITTILLVVVAMSSQAQNQKGDTLVLSLYNNSTRYMLTLADFGPQVLSQSIMGDMVAAYERLSASKSKLIVPKTKHHALILQGHVTNHWVI